MKQLRLTSLMMVTAAATLGLATGCSSSSSKGGTGGTGLGGSTGTAGKAGTGGTGAVGGAAGGTTGSVGGAAGGTTGSAGGAAGGTTGSAGGAAGGTTGSAGGTTGTAGSSGGGGAGGASPTTLLVDHDDSDNNDDPPDSTALSVSDTFFATRLAAEYVPFATYDVLDDANPTTPSFTTLMPYTTVIWYTGDSYGKTMTASQQTTLKNWLDTGGKTLLVFSQNLFYDLGGGSGGYWTTPGTNTFLTNYIGAAGWVADAQQFGSGQDIDLNHGTYTVSGAAGTAFASLSFTVIADTPNYTTADVVNPATGTVALATVPADVDGTNANTIAPIVVLRSTAGMAGTSKVLYVGLTVEDIQGAPTNTGAEFFHAALKTVGLVQ